MHFCKIENKTLMGMRYGRLILAAALAAALCSCKDKLSDVKLMMTGQPDIEIDDYVAIGSEHELASGGITEPEDGVRYYWYISGVLDNKDTTDLYCFTMPDEFGTYTVTSVAFADGYYDRSTNKDVTVVDDGFNKSLNIGDVPGIQEFSDTRDGNVYRYVSVGGTDWFVTNLAWRGAGVPYKESEVLWNVFGGYYTFDEVSSGDLCPEGWRVPSDADWRALGQALAPAGRASVEESEVLTGIAPAVMARAYFNNEKMWPYSPECDPDNASGISAVPAGYFSQTQFVGMNEYSAFWTSDTYSDTGCGIYRYIYYETPDVKVAYADPASFKASVRCVR